MADEAERMPKIFQGYEHRLTICGKVDIHFHVHFDHAALSAKLREATSELKAAVDANQPSPPAPLS